MRDAKHSGTGAPLGRLSWPRQPSTRTVSSLPPSSDATSLVPLPYNSPVCGCPGPRQEVNATSQASCWWSTPPPGAPPVACHMRAVSCDAHSPTRWRARVSGVLTCRHCDSSAPRQGNSAAPAPAPNARGPCGASQAADAMRGIIIISGSGASNITRVLGVRTPLLALLSCRPNCPACARASPWRQ